MQKVVSLLQQLAGAWLGMRFHVANSDANNPECTLLRRIYSMQSNHIYSLLLPIPQTSA
jgi:hypothetical protein